MTVDEAIKNLLAAWSGFENRMLTEIDINGLLQQRVGDELGEVGRRVRDLVKAHDDANPSKPDRRAAKRIGWPRAT